MTQERDGAASGVTNEGNVLVCVNYGDQCLTAELDIQAAELFAKTLLLAIDVAKQMEVREPDKEPIWYHCKGVYGEDRFYNTVETQPEGCTPLYAKGKVK